jgi:hypothetical protein
VKGTFPMRRGTTVPRSCIEIVVFDISTSLTDSYYHVPPVEIVPKYIRSKSIDKKLSNKSWIKTLVTLV